MLTIYRFSKCSQSVDILFLCCGSVAFTKHCHNHYSFKSNRYCHTSLLTCFRCCDSMHVLLLTQTTVHVMVSLKFSLFCFSDAMTPIPPWKVCWGREQVWTPPENPPHPHQVISTRPPHPLWVLGTCPQLGLTTSMMVYHGAFLSLESVLSMLDYLPYS